MRCVTADEHSTIAKLVSDLTAPDPVLVAQDLILKVLIHAQNRSDLSVAINAFESRLVRIGAEGIFCPISHERKMEMTNSEKFVFWRAHSNSHSVLRAEYILRLLRCSRCLEPPIPRHERLQHVRNQYKSIDRLATRLGIHRCATLELRLKDYRARNLRVDALMAISLAEGKAADTAAAPDPY